ncbi:hypothetical protein ABIA52_003940 [Paenarthrobacter histidinolovorans]|uniref:Uncharacterized protein n=1 Tax=Paenarthrobacter histidinolovorans TaxID=43664 RepID=A0ABW8NBT6_9MICC
MSDKSERQGYWYELESRKQMGAVDVLNALRDYRTAEAEMRRRTRTSMGMGETDLLALRYLLEAERAGREVGPQGAGCPPRRDVGFHDVTGGSAR